MEPDSNYLLYNNAYNKLNEFQKGILKECNSRSKAGLSLPMGAGKTFVSIMLALKKTKLNPEKPILVVAAKSLIENWKYEIKKFFGNELNYIVLFHKELKTYKHDPKTRLILTTPEIVKKCYKLHYIENRFVEAERVEGWGNFMIDRSRYNKPEVPFLNIKTGTGFLYSIEFGMFIVDEAQKYTNINTQSCKSLGAICCKQRWVLSGTMFDEPKAERILGYHIILDYPDFPRTLPEAKNAIKSYTFKGVNPTLVKRDTNPMFKEPKINKIIVSHNISHEEQLVYQTLKEVLDVIIRECHEYQALGDVDNFRKFNAYKLALLTYLRQNIVVPLITIANISLNIADITRKDDLSKILNNEYEKLNLQEWLNDENSIKSSRIKEVLKVIDNHKDEKLVVFSCFRTSIDILKYFCDRNYLSLDSSMDIKKRGTTIEEFQNSNDNVLFLSYDLGAEGLNLQCAHTVLIVDFWWNTSKTRQAIARVLRYGQKSKVVNIYFFTSNTGIEKALFDKQMDKEIISKELETGPVHSKVRTLKVDELLKLIDIHENTNSVQETYID
jgi:SNF2 family DNA or RNA helicase